MTYQLSPQYKRNMDDLVGSCRWCGYVHTIWTLDSSIWGNMPNNHFGGHKNQQNPNVNGWNTANTKTTGQLQELFAAWMY